MTPPRDDDVDTRFDPRFQRGYDPARHDRAPAPAARVDRNSGDPTAAASAEQGPTPTPESRSGELDPGQTVPPTRRGVSIPGVVLLALGVVLLGGALAIVRFLYTAVTAGDALASRSDRFPSILLQSAPTPMSVAGCVALVVGVALLLLAPPRRPVDDDEGPDA